jgi:beta-galactosidase
MVRLWTWQAFAHGAEVVSYFRWRQAPFAQEQMHAGLNRPDRSLDQGGVEAIQVTAELKALGLDTGPTQSPLPLQRAPVALVLDYPSLWMVQIQPQGTDYNAIEITFRAYSALRALGLDVDIVSSRADLDGYALVVLPAHLREDAALAERLASIKAQIVLGPRSGAKTQSLSIPPTLAPGAFAAMAGVQVQRVASLPPGLQDTVRWADGSRSANTHWREDVALADGRVEVVAHFVDGAPEAGKAAQGKPAVLRNGNCWYSAGWPDAAGWSQLFSLAARAAGLQPIPLPHDVRTTRLATAVGDLVFVQNFSGSTVAYAPSTSAQCLLGARDVAPQGLAIWKTSAFN